MKECLFRYKKFENKEEKDTAIRELKRVAGSLMQKHTLANLGKGKFRSLVAKCISESDLSLEVESLLPGSDSQERQLYCDLTSTSIVQGTHFCEFFC